MSETKKTTQNNDRINSIKLTDNNGIISAPGNVYELDFNRDAIRFAENRGFKIEEVQDYPVSKMPELFYYSFRMHNRSVAKDKTDKLIEAWGGALPESVLRRLIELYNQAQLSNSIQFDEEAEKNGAVTVEL